MTTRSKPPQAPRSAPRRPSPGKSGRGGMPAPRRPGTPGRSRTAASPFPWVWLAIGAGGLLLIVALIFGGRALFAPKATPTALPPTSAPATAQPTETPAAPSDVITPTATLAPTPDVTAFAAPDIPALQRLMLQRINEDRRANGLGEVVWDETAALAGTQHAKEMAQYGYISHRNLDGYGPDYRYSMAGGAHYSMENVHATWHSPGGGPQSAAEWEQWMRDAQQSLMESEGHRANILQPEHTHVGIGMAYEPATGYFAIAQEFVNQYVTVQPLLRRASLGDAITLSGWLGAGVSNPVLNIAYEPQPTPLSLDALKAETYTSPAENYDIPDVRVTEDGQFTASFTLDNQNQPGLYHIRLWAETKFGQVQVMNTVIQVQ
ncbi:MAG: hypothetical protein JXA21_07465 [Anaerolineae bacterium]|nr:hypothetical protein [Anaerolineae bacterium]